MGNMMTEILNKITEGTACWYPSAGSDLEAIDLWQNDYGNQLSPNTFIFSDISYIFTGDNLFCELKSFNAQLAEAGFRVIGRINEHITNLPKYSIDFIEQLNAPGRVNAIKEFIPSLRDEEFLMRRELLDQGLYNIEEFIAHYRIRYEEITMDARAVILINESRKINLILVYMENHELYEYLRSHDVEMPCFMIRRCDDEGLKSKKELLKELKVKEGFFNKNDNRFHLPEIIHRQDFIWSSLIYDYKDPSEFLKFRF